MKIIKLMLQKNIEYSQMNPEKVESLMAITHSYAMVGAITKQPKNSKVIQSIFKRCVKFNPVDRAYKIQPFTAKMLAEVDRYIGTLNVSIDVVGSEYDAIDFSEQFDTFATQIPDYDN